MPGFGDGPRFFNLGTYRNFTEKRHGFQQTCFNDYDPHPGRY